MRIIEWLYDGGLVCGIASAVVVILVLAILVVRSAEAYVSGEEDKENHG